MGPRQWAVERVDADDGREVLRGHAGFDAGAVEFLPVSYPEIRTFLNALFGQENRAVFVPRPGLLRRPIHGVDDGGLAFRALQQLAQLPLADRVLAGNLVDEALDVGATRIDGCSGTDSRAEDDESRANNQTEMRAGHQEPI